MPVNTPKLKVPFTITGTSAAVVEQDSNDEINQCVEAILRTPVGTRLEEPEYGVPDQTFAEGGIDTEEISQAITEWEPRAEVEVEEPEDVIDLVERIKLSTQSRGQEDFVD